MALTGEGSGPAVPTAAPREGGPARVVGAVVMGALLLIGLLHGVWAVSTWPLSGREDFARLVVGVEVKDLPSAGMTAGVALLLLVAGYLVGAVAGLLPRVGPNWLGRLGVGVVAGVLLLRGVGGLAADLFSPGYAPADFVRLDRIVYSPLCVVLGLGAAWVVVRALGSRRE